MTSGDEGQGPLKKRRPRKIALPSKPIYSLSNSLGSYNEPISISDSPLKAHVKQKVIEVSFAEVDRIMKEIRKEELRLLRRKLIQSQRFFKDRRENLVVSQNSSI